MTAPYVEGALVSGVSAHVLDRILASPNVSHVLASLAPWMRPEVEQTRRAIRRAAKAYEALPRAASGSTEADAPEVGPGLPHEITTTEASALLALSERRIRQLAAEGMGRQFAGRWLLDRSAVLAYADRRRGDL
ncbi:hypothetical protein BX265_4726 [Streptomyces sp. TLI_235]|nr:helix-turn-helix domain-containing protein [Streptomyces sp. TLI_235]PBC79897.1 hypothetical protein BX265_4726 [Streptomyces sp. TLI_235]